MLRKQQMRAPTWVQWSRLSNDRKQANECAIIINTRPKYPIFDGIESLAYHFLHAAHNRARERRRNNNIPMKSKCFVTALRQATIFMARPIFQPNHWQEHEVSEREPCQNPVLCLKRSKSRLGNNTQLNWSTTWNGDIKTIIEEFRAKPQPNLS